MAKSKVKKQFARDLSMTLSGRGKVEVEKLPIPICPRCGSEAIESVTQYGIRSSCCGLWSWSRGDLADKATHDLRKLLHKDYVDLQRAMGAAPMFEAIRKKTGINDPVKLMIKEMNEATLRKVKAAAEDIMIDILTGQQKVKA
jgi:hypothetical protein